MFLKFGMPIKLIGQTKLKHKYNFIFQNTEKLLDPCNNAGL